MSLQQILSYIKSAEKELTKLVEQEQTTSNTELYVFVYEQTFKDTPGWGPNYQHIYAYDIEQAFQAFGHCIKVYGIKARNIHYGSQDEMSKETERVSDYWRELGVEK
jgi:hypothetical protein